MNLLVRLNPKIFGQFLIICSFLTGTSYYFLLILRGGTSYQTADWLINYEGGFVRRGLFGSIFLNIVPNAEYSIYILFIFQTFLSLIVFRFFFLQLQSRPANWFTTVLICNPANICFYGWDVLAYGRKEMLTYFSIILLFQTMQASSKRKCNLLAIGSVIVYFIAVFSWETSSLFLPVIIFLANKINLFSRTQKLVLSLIYVSISTLGLMLSIAFHGRSSQIDAICESVRSHDFLKADLCSGAISAIGWSSEYTIGLVKNSYPLYLIYFVFLIIVFAPLFVLNPWSYNGKPIVVVVTAFLPLFFLVSDYGRWISFASISILFLLLASNNNLNMDKHISPIVAVVYLVSWGLPHWVNPQGPWPLLGFFGTPISLLF